MRIQFSSLVSISLAMAAQPVVAGLVGSYNFGATFEGTTSYAQLGYDTPMPRTGGMPENCEPSQSTVGEIHCLAYLVPDVDNSFYPSVFLEQPFKRQGLFFFDWGLTLATLSYQGVLAPKPNRGFSPGAVQDAHQAPGAPPDQPLTRAMLDLYGIDWRVYLQLGFTPRYFPDLMVQGGLGIQTVAGRVRIFKENAFRMDIQPELFVQGEVVFLRGYTGSMSLYGNVSQNLPNPSTIVDDNPSGTQLTNIQLTLISSSIGLKILFPF